mgnify:CR=1 FL=1|jgi:hypothetical protein|tara:strand:- start:367 stop:780 length:414 start_codon:yes stop_codon:yes gene_type:complete
MFEILEFKNAHNLLMLEKKDQAQEILISLRKDFSLHPDYLFLMSLFLNMDNRIYLAIDSLLLSIKIDNDMEFLKKRNFIGSSTELIKERYLLLISLFIKIDIPKLTNLTKEALDTGDHLKFINYVNKIMPGIRLRAL